jgi:hypothetical protein
MNKQPDITLTPVIKANQRRHHWVASCNGEQEVEIMEIRRYGRRYYRAVQPDTGHVIVDAASPEAAAKKAFEK